MMMIDLPWPHVLLGLAAALAILVVYDLAYVWPLCRRVGALAAKCRTLEELVGDVPGLAERVAAPDRRGREDLRQLRDRLGHLELGSDGAYEQAIGCAERGEEVERLRSFFGLTEGEADLVRLLHGDRRRRTETRKVA